MLLRGRFIFECFSVTGDTHHFEDLLEIFGNAGNGHLLPVGPGLGKQLDQGCDSGAIDGRSLFKLNDQWLGFPGKRLAIDPGQFFFTP